MGFFFNVIITEKTDLWYQKSHESWTSVGKIPNKSKNKCQTSNVGLQNEMEKNNKGKNLNGNKIKVL